MFTMPSDEKEEQYDHVRALVRGLHGPIRNVARPGTPVLPNAPITPPSQVYRPLRLDIPDKPHQVPALVVTAPASDAQTRRFSFGLRRQSAVRIMNLASTFACLFVFASFLSVFYVFAFCVLCFLFSVSLSFF